MAIIKRFRSGKDGYVTPYLDFHYQGQRWTETLPLLKHKSSPKNLIDRQEAKERKEMLNRIVKEKEFNLLIGEHKIAQKNVCSEDFLFYIQNFLANQTKQTDVRIYKSMFIWFKKYVGKERLFAFEIDEAYLRGFLKYLEINLNYETPSTYFKKLRRIVKLATKQNIFKSDPAAGIQVRISKSPEKDTLNATEIEKLVQAECSNNQIKNAFIFALYTGMRFVDINLLTWKEVNNNTLSFIQHKTNVPVIMPLHPNAIECIGNKKKPNEKVFHLPSHTACLKSIRKWTKTAGVDKHITFHVSRHSFGSNLVENGVDISVTARLLGHTSLKHTMRYVRTSESLKSNAINALPFFQKNKI